MDIEIYLDKMRRIQTSLLEFLEDDELSEEKFTNLTELFLYQHQPDNYELKSILHMILSISNNHCRSPTFFTKILRIIQHFKIEIKGNFSNSEIFDFFVSNKRILLYLIEEQILIIDREIAISIHNHEFNYSDYFYPEIKQFMTKKEENELSSENLNNFDEKRRTGENESYLCNLIRNDNIDQFIIYINQTCISLNSTIKSSIFESNLFLLERDPSLIEYSAFFGSIRIFNYLKSNQVDISDLIWLYAIHGNNPEIINILEDDQTKNENELNNKKDLKKLKKQNKVLYSKLLYESIKCNHEKITNYLMVNFIDEKYEMYKNENIFDDSSIAYSIRYYNFLHFPPDFNNKFLFYYFCEYDYFILVNFFMKTKSIDLNEKIKKGKTEITALKLAAKNNCINILNLLISSNPDLKIPPRLFVDCDKLTTISIPSSMTTIQEESFENCKSLRQVTIPSSVKYIGKRAFKGCISLMKISILSSNITIKEEAFCDCNQVIISKEMLKVPSNCFYNSCSLKQVLFENPSLITSIGNYAFYNCLSLTQIILPSSLTSIGDYAFYKCSLLTNIDIPSSLTSIGENAFNECSSLIQITIPSSVISIYKLAFHSCTSLKKVTFESPSSLQTIKYFMFNMCTSLEEITIPSSVTIIESYAFENCKSLKKMIIPSSVKLIGHKAFNECSSLTHISILSSDISICEKVFNINTAVLSNDMIIVPPKCFYLCSLLTHITIPSSIKSIESNAFYGCESLIEIIFPSSITSIKSKAFELCTSLVNIVFPSSVNYIGDEAFFSCSSLEKISFDNPSSLTSFNFNVFGMCSSLKEILIPSSVTKINDYAFNKCLALEEIIIPSSVTSIGQYTFSECSSLKKISIACSFQPNFLGIEASTKLVKI